MTAKQLRQFFQVAALQHRNGNWEAAEECLHRILKESPRDSESLDLLSQIQFRRGRVDDALLLARQAVRISPNVARFCHHLALFQEQKGLLPQATASLQRAVSLKGGDADLSCDLARLLAQTGQSVEAAKQFEESLRIEPAHAGALAGLARLVYSQNRHQEAVDLCGRFAEVRCREMDLLCVMRALLLELAEREVDVGPAAQKLLAEIAYQMGTLLRYQHSLDQAILHLEEATSANPSHMDALCSLGDALKDRAQLDEALACYRRTLDSDPCHERANDALLYAMLFHPAFDSARLLQEHQLWCHRIENVLPVAATCFANTPIPDRIMRVGYLSAHFGAHCQSLFTVPLLTHHNSQNVEVFGYSDVAQPGAITRLLQRHCRTWREIRSLTDDQVADLIRKDRIDILVDLTMHMGGNRWKVFAAKPAPIQVSWLAYPYMTGLPAMDYRLSDVHLDPPGEQQDAHYLQATYRLPHTFWCYDPLTDQIPASAPPVKRLGYITFGSLNNFCKMNEDVIGVWAAILRHVDRSHLLLLSPAGYSRQWTVDSFLRRGIAADRIEFTEFVPRVEYLRTYNRIDIGLDPFPCNGHTTTLDALWMGVPVITLVGTTVMGRAGLSQLTNLGLEWLIAKDRGRYIQIAEQLGHDHSRIDQLRDSLRGRLQSSPLMDGAAFASQIEEAYRKIWSAWCERRPTEPVNAPNLIVQSPVSSLSCTAISVEGFTTEMDGM